jgi:ribosomal 50S subunit-associated protein YjgA (DUF615 family)
MNTFADKLEKLASKMRAADTAANGKGKKFRKLAKGTFAAECRAIITAGLDDMLTELLDKHPKAPKNAIRHYVRQMVERGDIR